MLKIFVKGSEYWNERTQEFIDVKDTTLNLEHSLVSISKWEAKHHKPFITNRKEDDKTQEEIIDYIKCMTLNQNIDDSVYLGISRKNLEEIRDYIDDPMTATTITTFDDNKRSSNKPVTSEVIYSWMISLNIPVEFQKWHINRLLTLIKVCNINNNPSSNKRKISKQEIISRNAALNAARKKKFNTTG